MACHSFPAISPPQKKRGLAVDQAAGTRPRPHTTAWVSAAPVVELLKGDKWWLQRTEKVMNQQIWGLICLKNK
jgi:hypothetical protein